MQHNAIIKRITPGYQITIPNEFRKDNDLDIGSMISIYIEGDRLVIEPFRNKSEALKKLKTLFDEDTPAEFANLSEKEISKIVSEEVKSSRK